MESTPEQASSVVTLQSEFTVKTMKRDCHSLFRAVALSMTGTNELFVDDNSWVTDSAINALRDAAAHRLIVHALDQQSLDHPKRAKFYEHCSYATRTYVNVGTPQELSWGTMWTLCALAACTQRPFVVLTKRVPETSDESVNTYGILFETTALIDENKIPVFLIASETNFPGYTEQAIYYYDLAERQIDTERIKEYQNKWNQKQYVRNVLMLFFKALTSIGNRKNALRNNVYLPDVIDRMERGLKEVLIEEQEQYIDIRKRLIDIGEIYYNAPHNFTDANWATVVACLQHLLTNVPALGADTDSIPEFVDAVQELQQNLQPQVEAEKIMQQLTIRKRCCVSTCMLQMPTCMFQLPACMLQLPT